MAASLLDLVDDMLGRIFKSILCKKRMERKKNSECRFDRLKSDKLIYRCRECKEKPFFFPITELIRKFPSTYQFCNGALNKFILLLRKSVYPYEDMSN